MRGRFLFTKEMTASDVENTKSIVSSSCSFADVKKIEQDLRANSHEDGDSKSPCLNILSVNDMVRLHFTRLALIIL